MASLKCCDIDFPESDDIFWEAKSAGPLAAVDHPVHLYKLHVVKRTDQGVWLQDGFLKYWRSYSTATSTKQQAISRLYYKKIAHVRHCKRRLQEAETALECAKKAMEMTGQEVLIARAPLVNLHNWDEWVP